MLAANFLYSRVTATTLIYAQGLVVFWLLWLHKQSFLRLSKRTDVLPQDLMKSRSRKILVQAHPIALKFDRHIGNSADEMPVKCQSDGIIIKPNLAASSLHEILREDVLPLSE